MAPVRRGREEEEEARAAQLRADTLRLLAIARGEDPRDAALDIRLEDGLVVVELARPRHPPPAQPQGEERHTPFDQEQQLALDALDDRLAQLGLNGPPHMGLPEKTQRILAQFGLRGPEGYHPSPLPPPTRMELHTVALSEGIKEMRALPDARYDLYSWEFFKAYLQSPRPVDPPEPATDVLHVPELAARYPYLADEVTTLTRLKTAEQREAVGRGLLLQVDAAKLASLEERFKDAVWAGKDAMVAKLWAEVRYAQARLRVEAMAEKIKAAGRSH